MDLSDMTQVAVTLGALAGFGWKMSRLSKEIAGRAEAREITPQPLRVQSVERPVSESSCRERHASMEDRMARIERRLEWGEKRFTKMERGFSTAVSKVLVAGAEREQRLSDRIGDVVKGMADLKGYVRGKFESNGNGEARHE